MNNNIRFELSFKNISQLENKLNFCKLNNIKNINIPCKGLIKKDLFNSTIKYISKNYNEFNVTYHYSLYHQYLKNKEKLSNLSAEKDEESIKDLSQQIIKLGGKPSLEEADQKTLIKNLTKQLETISVNAILDNKSKNIIKDDEINGVKLRIQKIDGLPPKELRKLVDKGKKDLGEGIVVVFANKDDKVGLAVGVTDNLTSKFDAVKFVKVGSEIIGGKGGGGRKDFAQAGGQDQSKIEEAFKKLKSLI